MTVAELIEKLTECDPDLPVKFYVYTQDCTIAVVSCAIGVDDDGEPCVLLEE